MDSSSHTVEGGVEILFLLNNETFLVYKLLSAQGTLDPFCGGFWRCLSYLDPFMLLRPFLCLLRAPALVALAMHCHCLSP